MCCQNQCLVVVTNIRYSLTKGKTNSQENMPRHIYTVSKYHKFKKRKLSICGTAFSTCTLFVVVFFVAFLIVVSSNRNYYPWVTIPHFLPQLCTRDAKGYCFHLPVNRSHLPVNNRLTVSYGNGYPTHSI